MGHVPVLVEEVLQFLDIQPHDILVEGTLGLGGHAQRFIPKTLAGSGRYIGIERDPESLKKAHQFLLDQKILPSLFPQQIRLIHGVYSDMKTILLQQDISSVNKIFLDLGVSSFQLDTPERGFSFRHDAPLDMRFDPAETLGPTAQEILQYYSEKQLADLFYEYGEIPQSRRLARALVQERLQQPLRTTSQLAHLAERILPCRRHPGRKNMHPATRVFQALRIEVNQELMHLQQFLDVFPELLTRRGRIGILSYHSLEDRLVKTSFKKYEEQRLGKRITKKPLRPSSQETADNPRSRSARFRVWEKG